MAENWLVSEIVSGLQKLLALRLAGTPPEDSIKATGIVWIEALDDCGIKWVEHLDRERVQRAFKTMYRTCDRWPAPKLFLDNLGNRDPPPALPPPQISEEQRKKNVAQLRELMKKLGREKSMYSKKEL